MGWSARWLRVVGLFIFLTSLGLAALPEANCTTTDNFVSFQPTNTSYFDEAKHRTNDHQPYREDQQLNKHLDDQDFHRKFNDQRTDKGLEEEEEISSLELKVRPLSTSIDDEQIRRQFIERDEDIVRINSYRDKEKINGYADEHQSGLTHLKEENANRNFEDEYPMRHYDDKHLTRPANNQYTNKNLEDESVHRFYDEELSNRNFNKDLVKAGDSLRMNENPNGDRPLRRYDDEHITVSNDDQRPNKNSRDDKYFNKSFKNQDPYRNLNDNENSNSDSQHRKTDKHKLNLNERPNPPNHNSKIVLDDRNLNRHPDELRLNGHNFEKHIVDEHPDRQEISEQLDKYYKLQSNKYRGDSQFDRRLNDPQYERRLEEPSPNSEDQYLNRHSNTLEPEKNSNASLYSQKVDEKYYEKNINDRMPGRTLNEPIFERRLVDQTPEKHVDTDVHPNRRISEESFEQRIIDQYSNTKKEGSNLHPDGDGLYPERRLDDGKVVFINDTTLTPRKESNISHLMTFNLPRDWDESKPKLEFPKKYGEERFRMATLHLDKGLFAFDFLRHFLSIMQPRDFPLVKHLRLLYFLNFGFIVSGSLLPVTIMVDLMKDAIEGKVNVSTLIKQAINVEIVFIGLMSVFVVLMFVVPGTECWLCCRPNRYNYQRRRHGTLVFFLYMYCIIIGACVVTMLICNEEAAAGIERIPETMEAALQDLRDYHSGTAVQLRKCLTRSLDVASEAILSDLDNVEDLLGKPVQAQLSSETGVDVALESLMDVANATTELSYKTDALLKRAERAREFGVELSREADQIRRDLERTSRDCSPEDRSLCAVLDASGLHLALRLERVARDDRLLRLRQAGRENLTEAGRQARGEYLYVPHHVARTTLEARNLIRREINTARAKVSDEARSIEASGSDASNQLDTIRRLTNQIEPYVHQFEYWRWYVGFGTAMCVLLIWLLLFGALCCRCGCSEHRVRPTLLWLAFFSILVSMGLWLVLMMTLTLTSHAEMFLCRPFDDPEYRTIETVLETRAFLGRRLSVPLKDLFEKCNQQDSAYPAFQMDNTVKLEQLTAHWTWTGLTRAFSKLKIDLSSLRILTPNLRERLQNLLYACGPNLTEHRIMIQGPILNKDLNALSDQVENVARQLMDRRTARSFQTLGAQMRDLLSRRVKPLMKMQDELVYQLATLELHLQPLQRQVNQSLSHLRTVQYYIDSQGEKIAQLKIKAYVDRLGHYMDQWRAHVLIEMSSGVAKCRPLWDILQGIKLLVCSHILGPLNGFWFATLICVVTMLVSTPSAHSLASTYWRQPSSKGSVLLPSRQGSPDTVILARETWRTPDPPPSMDSW